MLLFPMYCANINKNLSKVRSYVRVFNSNQKSKFRLQFCGLQQGMAQQMELLRFYFYMTMVGLGRESHTDYLLPARQFSVHVFLYLMRPIMPKPWSCSNKI